MGIIKEDHQKWSSAAICSLWNSSETYVTKLSSSIVEQLNIEVDKGQMFIHLLWILSHLIKFDEVSNNTFFMFVVHKM